MSNLSRIAKAVENTKAVVPGYFESTCAQRASLDPKAAGSIVEGITASKLEDKILNVEWEEYSSPSALPGVTVFKTRDISGRLGVVDLSLLPNDLTVTLNDSKNTGQVYAVMNGVLGPKVDFTVIILGEEQGKEVVFTFHPGDPVNPSLVQMDPEMDGLEITVEEALEMGLETVKIV